MNSATAIATTTEPGASPDAGLDEVVRKALGAATGKWRAIAEDPDAGVSHSWISKFVRNQIPNPGYQTLRTLLTYLERKGLVQREAVR